MCMRYKSIVLVIFLMIVSTLNAGYLKFGDDNIATDECRQRLMHVNIEPKQFIKDLDRWHLFNVALTLRNNDCFQQDFDFYKNGGQSEFSKKLTLLIEPTIQFLNDKYSEMVEVFPHSYSCTSGYNTEACDLIIRCGDINDVAQKLYSLSRFREEGYVCRKIFFIVNNDQCKNEINELVAADRYSYLFEGVNTQFIVANRLKSALAYMKREDLLGCNYAVVFNFDLNLFITDIENAKFKYSYILEPYKCMGFLFAPIKDWCLDVKLHGYREKFPRDICAATIAWAASEWNLISHQVLERAKVCGLNV